MSLKNYRILVIDDLADNLFLMKTFLESEGYIVDIASDAATAFEKLEVSFPDLILLDVMMPDVDGYTLTKQIRRQATVASVPIVLITASSESCRVKGLAAGATEFVRKPLDLEGLLSTIQRLLKVHNSRSFHEESWATKNLV